MQEMWVRSLGQEDPLEEGMATHSSISCLENPHGQRNLEPAVPEVAHLAKRWERRGFSRVAAAFSSYDVPLSLCATTTELVLWSL